MLKKNYDYYRHNFYTWTYKQNILFSFEKKYTKFCN